MAQCKLCGKGGLFLSVDEIGLCSICSSVTRPTVKRIVEIVNESQDIINKSKNIKTQISRCDVVINRLEYLLKYENRGIDIISPPPSEIINNYREKKTDLVLSYIKSEIENAREKAELATTVNSGVNAFNKVLNKILELYELIEDKSSLKTLEETVKRNMFDFKIKRHIEDAEKSEFKGNVRKAQDFYMEALFLMEKENIENEELKKKIQSKVEKLKTEEGTTPKRKKKKKLKCESCGNELKDGQKFCTKCGSKIS